MKQLKIFILSLCISFYFPTSSFAYTELECSQLAAKAKTEWAAKKISLECGPRDSFFSKSHDLKCAIKAGEATTEWAAKKIMVDCQYMTQGYIIQFYHPIEADLPEDIREDWMQWHHEELIRDNKVFETVQLKLDIQNLGMPFSFLYSRKDKVFTTEEQNTIDKICRNLGEYTKKKFTITVDVKEDRSYGGSDMVGGNWMTRETRTYQNRVTQFMTYTYTFPKSEFYLSVRKVFATNSKESKEMLSKGGAWDHYAIWLLQDPTLFPKSFKAKDINGIIMFSDAKIENKNKPNFYDFGYSFEDIFSCTLLSYNSKWPQQIEKELVKFFEKVAKEAK